MISREVRYGLIGGIACVCYTFGFYWVDPSLMIHPAVWWSGLAFFIIPMVPAARKADTTLPPSPFRRRLRSAFLVFLTAELIYYIFYWIMFNYIDPELARLQYEMAAPEGVQSVEDIEPTFGKTFFSFAQGLIGGFILSAIIAYIIERNA